MSHRSTLAFSRRPATLKIEPLARRIYDRMVELTPHQYQPVNPESIAGCIFQSVAVATAEAIQDRI